MTTSETTKSGNESGSTILGALSTILALFFIYSGATRLWWWYSFNSPDYLLLGLTYTIIGLVAIGAASYGLISKQTGAQTVMVCTFGGGALVFLAALYFWITGNFLGGTSDDVFNALALGLAGIVLFVIGGVLGGVFKRKGIETKLKNVDEDSITIDNPEQRGEEIGEQIVTKGVSVRDSIPWNWGVGIGVLLWLALFPLVNYETIFGIVLVVAYITLPVSIYYDWQTIPSESQSRSWMLFFVGSLVPIIALLFGIGWLLWRRRLASE